MFRSTSADLMIFRNASLLPAAFGTILSATACRRFRTPAATARPSTSARRSSSKSHPGVDPGPTVESVALQRREILRVHSAKRDGWCRRSSGDFQREVFSERLLAGMRARRVDGRDEDERRPVGSCPLGFFNRMNGSGKRQLADRLTWIVDECRVEQASEFQIARDCQRQVSLVADSRDPSGEGTAKLRFRRMVAEEDSAFVAAEAVDCAPQPITHPFVGHEPEPGPSWVAGCHAAFYRRDG